MEDEDEEEDMLLQSNLIRIGGGFQMKEASAASVDISRLTKR